MLVARVSGVGAWGPGFESWATLRAILLESGVVPAGAAVAPPRAECLPGRERRRAPLLVRLAVEVADQAMRASGIEPASAASVFASAMGDVTVTDYMCTMLARQETLLSPTQFHNSVHNAPAGYWSIATGSRAPSNSVSAYHHSFAIALLEAATQCVCERIPVLLVMADLETRPPFDALCPIEACAAVALMLAPDEPRRPGDLRLGVAVAPADRDEAIDRGDRTPERQPFSPVQAGIDVLALLAGSGEACVRLPASRGTVVTVTRVGQR